MRSEDPQSCSHLCPLMRGQRLSRPNQRSPCHEIRTHTFSMTFCCGKCTDGHSDALLLRRWMDGCRAEVTAVSCSLHCKVWPKGRTFKKNPHWMFTLWVLGIQIQGNIFKITNLRNVSEIPCGSHQNLQDSHRSSHDQVGYIAENSHLQLSKMLRYPKCTWLYSSE